MYQNPGPIHICIAGTGNLGTHLANSALPDKIKVTHVIGHSLENAKMFAGRYQASFDNTFLNIPKNTRFVILALPDDRIASCCKELADYEGVVVHCSGALPMDALAAAKHFGVMYPLQTFSKERNLYLKHVPFFVEACNAETLHDMQQLASCYTENIWEVNSQVRKQIHLAAVLSNNFINHLLSYSKNLLDEVDMPFEILHPLLKETIEKAMLLGPENAQTGPAVRRDKNTIETHLNSLQNKPDMQEYYTLITKLIQDHGKNNAR
ncbi:MAG: Rossmann-like and DUF2520 domain-containing protein [Bacteroidota bacterium]